MIPNDDKPWDDHPCAVVNHRWSPPAPHLRHMCATKALLNDTISPPQSHDRKDLAVENGEAGGELDGSLVNLNG